MRKTPWQEIPNPEWTIVGAPLPDGGVALLASCHLAWAKLQEVETDTILLQAMTAGWIRTGVFLSLHMGVDEFVIAAGKDYAEAFSILFGQWGPRGAKMLELPSNSHNEEDE